MVNKRFLCIMCILSMIICLYGCSNPTSGPESESNISNEIWCNPVYLPEDIDQTNMRMLNIPNRQQYVYKSTDGKNRIVIDIHTGDKDIISIETTQKIDINSKTGTTYCYNGEEFTFSGASTSAASGLVRMIEGETVLEWTQEDAYFRLHGTYSLDELVAIAEALEVRLP